VQASIRFSLGRGTTEAEIDRAADAVAAAVERQRQVARSVAARR
jgi:cysteine sulfinate desulfinase/cysteine desulfurase-like protein